MAHPRKLIREAVITRLADDIDIEIYSNRVRPIFQAKLPNILVYTAREPSEISSEGPREYKRNLELVIEIAAKADDALDDVLDDLAEQVENSIFKDETFGGLASDTLLTESEMVLLGEGERLIGSLQITLTIPYYMYLPNGPLEPLDPFETAFTDTGKSQDDIKLPQ